MTRTRTRSQESPLILGTTNYLYDGDSSNIVEEVDSSGNLLARYTQGGLFDQPLAELRSGTGSYYQADGLDSITSLSNSAGALVSTYSYDSFGNLSTSSGTLTNPFRYTGRESDSETSLYYYRARYYDPLSGRFISDDPRGFVDGVNFYRYVHNDPIDKTDPSGFTSYQGFPADLQVQMMNAVDEAIKQLSPGQGYDCSSRSCAGKDGPKLINIIQNATFVYQPNSKDCGQTGPASVIGLRHVFGIGPLAFGPSSPWLKSGFHGKEC